MAQGSFTGQINTWVAETKERQKAVRDESVRRVIEVMQEPGPSMATAAKAVAVGSGLGKLKAGGKRGVSKRAFGPIPNPGGSGNMPVDTGFLRASLVVGKGRLSLPTTSAPDDAEGKSYSWNPGDVDLTLASAGPHDAIEARYTAVYARQANNGGTNRRPRKFVDLAAQQWTQIVAQVASEAKTSKGG